MPADLKNVLEGLQIWNICPSMPPMDAATTMFASIAGAYLVVTALAF